MRIRVWVDAACRDLRYTFRGMRASPGFTAVATLSLALGIGANTAVFSVINAVLLKPLSIREPDNVVTLRRQSANSLAQHQFAYPEYTELRNQSAALMDIAAYGYAPVDIGAGMATERTFGAIVSGNYFGVLGVSPVLGRTFLPEEDRTPGAHPVAVISDRWWKRQFHSDAAAIGRVLKVNGRAFIIIGIAPPGFTGTVIGSAPDVWLPTMMWAGIEQLPAALRKINFDPLRSKGYSWLSLAGRLKPGVGIQAARASLNPIDLRQIETARLPAGDHGSMVRMLAVLFAVVGVLLLIACANVASLLIGRAIARQKEIAIRLALGARRGQIIRSLVTESMVLAALGCGAGMLIALWCRDALQSWRPLFSIPIPVEIVLDYRVLGFTALVSVLSGLAVGLTTALRATAADPVAGLDQMPSAAAVDRGSLSTRNLIMVGQIALSLLLLTGAGLLLKTFLNLQSIAIGFDPYNLILLNADFARHGYSEAAAIAAYPRLLQRIESLPGVQSASLAQYVPLTSPRSAWNYEDQPQRVIEWDENAVSPGYFRTMHIPLLRGRDFTAQDREGSGKVAILNEAAARLRFHNEDPIGKLLDSGGAQVIGVARDTRRESLRPRVEPWSFVPFAQSPQPWMSILIRTTGNPQALVDAVRRVALEIDPSIPASSVRLMTDQLKALLWQPRMAALLVGAFALLAALLAVIGVYGAVSFEVARRTHEIGIRMALGADRPAVLRMVLIRSVRVAFLGAAVGLCAAAGLTRLLAAMLYAVTPTDPGILVSAAALLIAVVALASSIPAHRASSVDPIAVLRYQ